MVGTSFVQESKLRGNVLIKLNFAGNVTTENLKLLTKRKGNLNILIITFL